MKTVDDYKRIFGVEEDRQLAEVFGKTPGAVSNWRKTGVPAAIERKATELMRKMGVVSEFGTFYGVAEIHRALTPEQEEILKALDDDPLMKKFAGELLRMDEADRAQAYADFKKKLKEEK